SSERFKKMRKSLEKVFLLLFSFLFLELSVRIITSYIPIFDIEMLKYSQNLKKYSKENPGLFFHQPNKKVHLMGVDVSTNSMGLRGVEVRKTKPTMRAIFLGDSLTFGWGVHQNKIFSSLVEQNLKTNVEVINFGHCNYNADQEFQLFDKKGDELNPDVVYIFHFLNDLEPTTWVHGVPLWTYSYFASLLVSRFRGFYQGLDYKSYYRKFYFSEAPYWERFKKSILKFSEEQKNKGRTVKVFILPDFHQFNPYELKEVHQKIVNELTALDIDTVDILPVFNGSKEAFKYWVAKDDPHPNEWAHKKISDFVTPILRQDYERFFKKK
ncbi:MAG: SGNH/GDSL hydrolase family protein, partial [Bdellovibrionales bacterium]|nr:SGNH/GDSL hydrolase family protein [Bdellovibrionales bacterium]